MIAYLISVIAALIIGESWVFANVALANPTLENAIAQRIETLKQSGQNWIEVDLSDQYLFAWQGSNQTFTTIISSGKATTPTHPGIYSIQRKYPQERYAGTPILKLIRKNYQVVILLMNNHRCT